jgi:CAI-1 autoinducer synthase
MSFAANQSFSSVRAELCMPEFVTRRMDEHYVTRVQQLLGGEHLHVWQPAAADAIMLAGNDYLCISNQAELIAAQARALSANQTGMLMSSVFLQEGSAQHRLEAKLAAFMGAEDGVLAQSGWAANVGLLQTIAGPGVPVYLDMMAHASLWEGVQSAQAIGVPFLHNDAGHLERQLAKHGPGVIVVDALYSTNGSVAPLAEVADIAERSGSILIAGHPRCARRRAGGRAGPERPGAFPHRLAGQGLRRARRLSDLLAPLQGLLPVGVAPRHLQLLPARP